MEPSESSGPRNKREARYANEIAQGVRAISATNRDATERFIRNRTNGGCKLGTLRSYVRSLLYLDRAQHGKPFAAIVADDAEALFVEMRRRYSPSTTATTRTHLRAFFR